MSDRRKLTGWVLVFAVLMLVTAFLTGCGDDDNDVDKPVAMTGTCLSCHQDAEILQATAETGEETGGESSGEG